MLAADWQSVRRTGVDLTRWRPTGQGAPQGGSDPATCIYGLDPTPLPRRFTVTPTEAAPETPRLDATEEDR